MRFPLPAGSRSIAPTVVFGVCAVFTENARHTRLLTRRALAAPVISAMLIEAFFSMFDIKSKKIASVFRSLAKNIKWNCGKIKDYL